MTPSLPRRRAFLSPTCDISRSCSRAVSLVCALALVGSAFGQEQASYLDCYAREKDGRLELGNSRIERVYEWNGGNLIPLSVEDKRTHQRMQVAGGQPEFTLGGATKTLLAGNFTVRTRAVTPVIAAHIEVEVQTSHPGLDVRRVFRVYSDCPAIACDVYLRRNGTEPPSFQPAEAGLMSMRPPGMHWKFTAIEFFDRTGANNTLVRPASVLLYKEPAQLRGNILFGRDLTADRGLFVLKESPCSTAQLNYPGFDFSLVFEELKTVGIGLKPADFIPGEWRRGYSVVLGVCGATEESFLEALRAYQNRARKFEPSRDDMIMMNTWGDRNADAKISEEFIRKQVDACARLGIGVVQIDDGWQQGLSANTIRATGTKHSDEWPPESWQPNRDRFPQGLKPLAAYAAQRGVQLGLWFNPSAANEYARWREDADIVAGLHRDTGIRYFKIDGIKLSTHQAEENLRKFFEEASRRTGGQVFFDLDCTDGDRPGYHYFYEYGNLFLENRYTEGSKKYFPHWTLRNLWMLAKYVPTRRLQIEFLNKWRHADNYPPGDLLAPSRIPFDYEFAITMVAQPLAWFEAAALPPEGFTLAPLIAAYRRIQADLHAGDVLPIGDEPSGSGWTGFQSRQEDRGYFLVFRENNAEDRKPIQTWLPRKRSVHLKKIAGDAADFDTAVDAEGRIAFTLPRPFSFALFAYELGDPGARPAGAAPEAQPALPGG